MPRPQPNDSASATERLNNTIGNMERAEAAMEFADGKELEAIKEKNDRRKGSIEGLQDEIEAQEKSKINGYI